MGWFCRGRTRCLKIQSIYARPAEVSVNVDEAALVRLSQFSCGLPVLAHEIGEATFKRDNDNRIDSVDALGGVMDAADIVGRKHLEPQIFRAISSVRYRAILRKVAEEPLGVHFKRADLLMLLPEKEKVLDNFLMRMGQLGVIRSYPDGGPGAYQFGNHLHHLYFQMEAERAMKSREE